jgi:hypothetical protein
VYSVKVKRSKDSGSAYWISLSGLSSAERGEKVGFGLRMREFFTLGDHAVTWEGAMGAMGAMGALGALGAGQQGRRGAWERGERLR